MNASPHRGIMILAEKGQNVDASPRSGIRFLAEKIQEKMLHRVAA
jgi:hypothetical protein